MDPILVYSVLAIAIVQVVSLLLRLVWRGNGYADVPGPVIGTRTRP